MQKKDLQEVWGTSALSCNGMDEGEHAIGFQLVECPCVASLTESGGGRLNRASTRTSLACSGSSRRSSGVVKVDCAENCTLGGSSFSPKADEAGKALFLVISALEEDR